MSGQTPGKLGGCLLIFFGLVAIGTCNRLVNGPPKERVTANTNGGKDAIVAPQTSESQSEAARPQQERVKPKPSPPPPVARQARPPRVSLSNYLRIQNGMSYNEVVEILGQPTSEKLRNQFEDVETVVFEWAAEGMFLVGTMVLTFQNGRLVQKSQAGLE